MTRLMLERIVLPRREYDGLRSADQGSPWSDEVQEAQFLASRWAAQWFEPAEAARWLAAHDDKITPELARRLSEAHITPEQAAWKIWYGKRNVGRPSVAVRVARGDISPDEARREIDAVLKNDQ